MATNKKTAYSTAYNNYMTFAKKNNPYSNTSKSARLYYNQLAKALADENASVNKYYNASNKMLKSDMNNSITKTNKQYDNSARQAYINYRQSQNALPEQLSNLGVTGGASETAGLKLTANYGTNIANNEASRNSAIADYKNTYSKNVAQNELSRNQALSSNRSTYNTNKLNYQQDLADKSTAYLLQARETARDRGLTASEKAQNKKVDNYNNKAYKNIAKLERQGYTVKTWTDSKGKVHYGISGNPTPTNTYGGSGGSGGGGYSSGSGSTSSGTTSGGTTNNNNTKKNNTNNTKKDNTPSIPAWNPAKVPDKIFTAMTEAGKYNQPLYYQKYYAK